MGLSTSLANFFGLTQPTGFIAPHVDSSHVHDVPPEWLAAFSNAPLTREEAMKIPAVVRARNLIVTTAARMGIIATRDGYDLDEQPRFISRSDGMMSAYHRNLWTFDDLLFYGWSLWKITRDATGHVLTADRVDYTAWSFDSAGCVTIDGRTVHGPNYLLIPGIHEGVLAVGSEIFKQARSISRGVTRAVETPAAAVELHQTNDRALNTEEINRLKADWIRARKGEGGGVAFTSSAIEVKTHGAPLEQLLIEGRNATAVDIARVMGIPAPMIDATLSGTSLSYSNTQSRLAELIEFGAAPIAAALLARLSMDDVVPRGVALRLDVSQTVATINAMTVPDDQTTNLKEVDNDNLRNRRLRTPEWP